MKTSTRFAAASALLSHGFIAACAPTRTSGPSQDQSTQPVKGGHVTEGKASDITGLNPITGGSVIDSRIQSMMFEGLLVMRGDGELVPQLAQSLPSVSSDGKTYTFALRKDLKWSDGRPLTADDVAFTYTLMYHADYREVKSTYRSELQAIVANVLAPDPYTVSIVLKSPAVSFLVNHGWRLIAPKHVLGNLAPSAFNAHDFNRAPSVVSGPFKFSEWQSGDHVTLVRNDGYYGGPPHLDRFTMKVIPADASAAGLKTGEIDVSQLTATAFFADLAAAPNVTFQTHDTSLGMAIYYNLDPKRPASKILASKAVRQALALAANRPNAVKAVLLGYGSVPSSLGGVYSPLSWAYNPEHRAKYSYDPKKAAELLEAEGWRMGPGGVREKDGVPLKFEILSSSSSKEFQANAAVFQQDWKEIGVATTIRAIPFSQLASVALPQHDFDVSCGQTWAGVSPDPDLSLAFHSRNAVPGGSNWSNYKNPQLDKLLDEAATIGDQAQRKALYFKIQDLLDDEVPAWTSQWAKYGWAFNKRVKNFSVPDQIGNWSQRMWPFMKDVWVTDGQ